MFWCAKYLVLVIRKRTMSGRSKEAFVLLWDWLWWASFTDKQKGNDTIHSVVLQIISPQNVNTTHLQKKTCNRKNNIASLFYQPKITPMYLQNGILVFSILFWPEWQCGKKYEEEIGLPDAKRDTEQYDCSTGLSLFGNEMKTPFTT